MNPFLFLGLMALAALAAYFTARADDKVALPYDEPTDVNGFEVACSGVGDEARTDPRWREYQLKVEFANGNAQYLADIDVALQGPDGEPLFQAYCESPWLLAKVPPGKYVVAGTYEGVTKTAKVTVPAKGQARIVIRFPEARGE